MTVYKFEDLKSIRAKKKFILSEQKGKCAICLINSWCDKPLTLQLDQKV